MMIYVNHRAFPKLTVAPLPLRLFPLLSLLSQGLL